ncbi:hypothetical protein V3C99_010560 [Haemonchus contortus]
MTGIKVNPQKEVHVPLQPSNEQQELDIPGRLRRQIIIRFAIAILFILTTFIYAIFLNKPHRQELLRHPYMEDSYALEDSLEYTDSFVEFMKKFDKTYKDDAEMLRRFKIYEKNMREISVMNRNGRSNAQFGENDLSDWTDEEFKRLRKKLLSFVMILPNLNEQFLLPTSLIGEQGML